jgi:hypothetical protein
MHLRNVGNTVDVHSLERRELLHIVKIDEGRRNWINRDDRMSERDCAVRTKRLPRSNSEDVKAGEAMKWKKQRRRKK